VEFSWLDLVITVVRTIIIFAGAMTMVPVLIWLERKLVAGFQVRVGPNRVGPFGLLQPLADALKLMMKEDITPTGVDKPIYYLAPLCALLPAVMALGVIPWGPAPWARITNLDHSLLYSLAISGLSVYAVAMAGWASNNKYSLMGGLRAAAQMISYELGMGLAIIVILLGASTTSLVEIVERQAQGGWGIFNWNVFGGGNPWLIIPMIIAALTYFTCGVAETNRAPFDMAEAESELTAGFHTEYSAFKFAIFFMAEYVNMVIVAALSATLFLGGWSGPGISAEGGYSVFETLLGIVYFLIKIFFFIFIYMWLRASLPRFRYDQLMNFGWKFLVPLGLLNIFLVAIAIMLNGWR
jgi:NADH-quinone oxidoreductase subunit H